jgi:hypothetical protein
MGKVVGFFNVNFAMNDVLTGGRPENWVSVRLNFFSRQGHNQWRGCSKFTPASNYILPIDFGVGHAIDADKSNIRN